MPKKSKQVIDLVEESYDDNIYDFDSNQHMLHRQQAEKKYLLRRRIEDLKEERELREQDYF